MSLDKSELDKDDLFLDNLFKDFLHPNPNINKRAYLDMVRYAPDESMSRLLSNLGAADIELRRKSVKALSAFGEKILLPICEAFHSNKHIVIRISCLKVLLLVVATDKDISLPKEIFDVIDIALLDDTTEVILIVISLLRQLDLLGLNRLISMTEDNNVLRAKASITALGEIRCPESENCLKRISADTSLDSILVASAKDALSNFCI